MLLRRRLQLSTATTSNSSTSATSTSTSDAGVVSAANSDSLGSSDMELLGSGDEDLGSASGSGSEGEDQAFTPEQLNVLAINGVLSLVLFAALAGAVLWMTYKHFRCGSDARKKAFHVVLFLSIAMNIPDPVGWIFFPATEKWVVTYIMRVYGVLLQCACKSYLALCWAEVVSAGRSDARRRMVTLVLVLNALVLVWAIAVPVILSPYPNDVYGQYDFMASPLRSIVTYTGLGIVLTFGILLFYQGMKLRVRLLQAKGTVPAGSVEKSLYQLMLTVSIIATSDLLRVVSFYIQSQIAFTPFVVINSLIPNIFPAICMLYLMRRVPKGKRKSNNQNQYSNSSYNRTGAVDATLSRYMAEDKRSDISDDTAYAAGSTKFALASTRVSGIARLEHHDQAPPPPSQLSPPFTWSR
ncbi:hypothetical protein Gpo141_00005173 [Globisporangium polare]